MSIRDISSGALWRCIILFSILFIVLSYNLLDDRYSHFARWYFFDIGQGDATLFETGEGSFFLFDAGPDRTIAKRLDRFLPSLHKSVDLIFISHPQKDHFNGIFSLFTSYRIGAIVYNGAVVDSDGWNNVVHEANRLHIPLIPVMSGDSIRHGGTVISILNPTFSTLQSAESNDTGLVALAEQGDFSVLLTADIGSDVERLLVADIPMPVDVLKVAHHGSRFSSSQFFIDSIRPRIAVVEYGVGNIYGHPAQEVIDRLSASGASVFKTGEQGTIEIRPSSSTVQIFRHAPTSL
jgi:competence protein ComEC